MSEAPVSEQVERIKAILADLKSKEETSKSAYESARDEYAAALAILAPPKPARAAKSTGKPRGPRKALGSGPTPPAGPESVPPETETLPDGIEKRHGRYYRIGSKLGYTMLTMAIAAAEEAQGTGE